MTHDQIAVFSILGCALGLFIWGRLRYDIVAFITLLLLVILDLIPVSEAFSGFAHPATITVAIVLIISRGLSNSGAIDIIAAYVLPAIKRVSLHIAALSGVAAVLSSVMNNVGALALLMPVAIESSEKAKRSPAFILMPMSFASILGGLVTLIGTPPNIIIANFRADVTGEAFTMFDFTPVGGVVALAGVAFVAFAGWHLIPQERRKHSAGAELFKIDDYIAEARVPKESSWIDKLVKELGEKADDYDIEIIKLMGKRSFNYESVKNKPIRGGDVLLIKTGSKELGKFIADTKLELVGHDQEKTKQLKSDDFSVIEAVVQSRSHIEGKSSKLIRHRSYGLNLLGVSRQGKRIQKRLKDLKFKAGDILLLHGESDRMTDSLGRLGCLPLAKRALKIGTPRQAGLAVFLFGSAIVAATMGIVPLLISLSIAAAAMVIINIIPIGEVYEGVDWPVIVLLGAMIPVGGALDSTGATSLIAKGILNMGAETSPVLVLTLLLIVTMTLSDIMNNAATAVVMAPVSVGIAHQLGLSADPFLMAVAVGASCAFLTPIGHQNNTLILGPGGYKFGDYWRMGLPLEILIVVLAIPMILIAWPL